MKTLQEYAAPAVTVREMQLHAIICTSDFDATSIASTYDEGDTSEW